MSDSSMQETHTFTAPEDFSGGRLDKFLADHLSNLSRTRIKSLIESGMVLLNDKTCTNASEKIKPTDAITLHYTPPQDYKLEPKPLDLSILYEDEHLLVVEKPSGLVVHPGDGQEKLTLVHGLLHHCGGTLSSIGIDGLRPGIVHRLDKDTSGILVVAKRDEAHLGLTPQFQDHSIERGYKALVWGLPKPLAQTVRADIGRHPQNRKKMAVVKHGGRPAVTHFKTEKIFHGIASLLDIRLETGRTHQIRVHLTDLGYPLVGDPVYGRVNHNKHEKLLKSAKIDTNTRKMILDYPQQALHAYKLGFIHPITGEHLMFESALSESFLTLLGNFSETSAE